MKKTLHDISRPIPALLFGLLLAGCATTGHGPSESGLRIVKLPDLSHMPATLAEQPPFTCTYENERIPPRDPEADKLYQHAKWLYERTIYDEHYSNQSEEHENDLGKALRYYRIAAAWGHDGAVNELAYFHDHDPDISTKEHVKALIGRGIPNGFFLMGRLLSYDNSYQNATALQFKRRAADLGNPEAQQYFAGTSCNCNPRLPKSVAKLNEQMTHCAAEQKQPKALLSMAYHFKSEKQYDEALKYAQMAVKAGNSEAARWLTKAFSEGPSTDEGGMGLTKDKERAERYGRISSLLGRYSRATVDEIDEIVPLPPAKLPAWDKQIRWLKRLDDPAPPLPSEERIVEMALKKGLDPETGLQAPPDSEEQPAFACIAEKNTPPREADAEKLFQYANWLYSENLRKRKGFLGYPEELPDTYPEIERLYRIATAWGHDNAARNLAHLLMGRNQTLALEPESEFISDFITKPVEIAEDLIGRGVPYGYTLMSYMLRDHLGVKNDFSASRRYLQKAAALGEPQAQYLLSTLREGEAGAVMLRCAANQGHSEAALSVAKTLHEEKKYDEALKYYQIAVMAGSDKAAEVLSSAFQYSDPDESYYYMGQAGDPERANRYSLIDRLLGIASFNNNLPDDKTDLRDYVNDYIHAKMGELDQIVPLPPARLPTWDEGDEWLKRWKRNEAPPLPSEQRIREMALKKGLDPDTGYPQKKDETGKLADEVSRIPGSLEGQRPFTCVRDRISSRDPDADNLYQHALHLIAEHPESTAEVERLYRIAAAWGHDMAAHQLALLLMDRHSASGDVTESVEIAEHLMRQGVPHGYHLMGTLLDAGLDIQQKVFKTALQYFRRAADLGDPRAQYEVGRNLMEFGERRPLLLQIGAEMIRCAQDQGQDVTPIDVQIEALIQSGASPEEISAGILSIVERQSGAEKQNVSPMLAEERIQEMARAKRLDPQTGLPQKKGQ